MPASDLRAGPVAWLARRALFAVLVIRLGSFPAPVPAQGGNVRVGVLKLTSPAPICLGLEPETFREKGYLKAAGVFDDAVLALRNGKPPEGPTYDEVVSITARYTDTTPDVVRVGFAYQDRDARLDVADIGRQLAWYRRAGMVTGRLEPRDLVDGSFLDEALRALPR
jgi:hypothetical protein